MQSSQEIPTGLITHTLMTRLPTTCECKTFNLKMLNTTIYKIAIINAHSVFYSCQVYFFFFLRKTVTLWLKLVSSTFEKPTFYHSDVWLNTWIKS